jgi:hypothetical protein
MAEERALLVLVAVGHHQEEEEIFDVQEINPPNYVHMGTLIFWLPQNPDWREKISYKGKTDLVRKRGKKIQCLLRMNLTLTIDFTRCSSKTSMSLLSFPRISLWQFCS